MVVNYQGKEQAVADSAPARPEEFPLRCHSSHWTYVDVDVDEVVNHFTSEIIVQQTLESATVSSHKLLSNSHALLAE